MERSRGPSRGGAGIHILLWKVQRPWGVSREAALELKLFGVVMSGEVLDLAGQRTFQEFGVFFGWLTWSGSLKNSDGGSVIYF